MFGMWKSDPTSGRFDQLMEELATLKRSVAELKGERTANRRVVDLEKEYADTKRQLTDLQIEFDREKERHAIEKREIEHLVGLERKRSEFERTSAAQEARLAVREENVTKDTDRFEKQMEFHSKRFEAEVGYLKDIMAEMMARLPKMEALVKLNGDAATVKSNGEE